MELLTAHQPFRRLTGSVKYRARAEAGRIEGKYEMAKVNNDTKVPAHGLFYMENAGGYGLESAHPDALPSTATDERRPSCFALEEERGEDWKGSGAMGPTINETRPSL